MGKVTGRLAEALLGRPAPRPPDGKDVKPEK
jgi:hypothetical protein